MYPMACISRCFRRCYGMAFWYTVWMSSNRFTAVRVLRLRVKDKHAAWLRGLAREVNTVFNYCNELSVKVFERERRFLSGFSFLALLNRESRGCCSLRAPGPAGQVNPGADSTPPLLL